MPSFVFKAKSVNCSFQSLKFCLLSCRHSLSCACTMKRLAVIILVFYTSYVNGMDEMYEDTADIINLDSTCWEGFNLCMRNTNCNNFWKRSTRGADDMGPFWANRGKKDTFEINPEKREPSWAMRGKKDPFWAHRGKKGPANQGKKDPFWANRGKKDPTFSISRLYAEEPHWELMRRDEDSRFDPYFTTRGKKDLFTEDSSIYDRQSRDNFVVDSLPFLAARGKKDVLQR